MGLEFALIFVAILIVVFSLAASVMSIWLAIQYHKYNRRRNSLGMTGQEIAKDILNANGLWQIKVTVTGSFLFGNSYSHYFQAVRLRRMTRHETSLTSLGMGAQKAALAILDHENDPDMRKRIRLVPLLTFGPFALIPLIFVGVLLDVFLLGSTGICTFVLSCVGFLFYFYSIVLSVLTLKTEKKAQERAYAILHANYAISEEDLVSLKELFRLYNIQYINDIILSSLELLYRLLQLAVALKGGKRK